MITMPGSLNKKKVEDKNRKQVTSKKYKGFHPPLRENGCAQVGCDPLPALLCLSYFNSV